VEGLELRRRGLPQRTQSYAEGVYRGELRVAQKGFPAENAELRRGGFPWRAQKGFPAENAELRRKGFPWRTQSCAEGVSRRERRVTQKGFSVEGLELRRRGLPQRTQSYAEGFLAENA